MYEDDEDDEGQDSGIGSLWADDDDHADDEEGYDFSDEGEY